jgi:glycosyltransferase involved in cell wall biosynthesis
VAVRFPRAEWWIIGDGPDRERLLALSRQVGVKDNVKFLGQMPREEVLKKLSQCDVLVHPCLRGAISMVCLEAMALGRPVICLDLGGPALQVTDETGLKVSTVAPGQVVKDLAQAMLQFASKPDHRQRMGVSGRKRVVEQFDWDKKGEWLRKVYEQVAAGKYRESA